MEFQDKHEQVIIIARNSFLKKYMPEIFKLIIVFVV